jgi:SAM-dependent methyltransferase
MQQSNGKYFTSTTSDLRYPAPHGLTRKRISPTSQMTGLRREGAVVQHDALVRDFGGRLAQEPNMSRARNDVGGVVRYDIIGRGYSIYRRADRRIAAAVHAALGDARTVVNVGAGAGSYEPVDRPVIPVEPSTVMAMQRERTLPPAVLGVAESLPLGDSTVDAAMAMLTIHHWADLARGIGELTRVASRRVVLLTIDADVAGEMWLYRDYIPGVADRNRLEFPTLTHITEMLNAPTRVVTVPVPADCTDGFALTFWSRPEAVLDPGARAATSDFARMDSSAEAEAVERLAWDLETGAWERAHGQLRTRPALDVGLRLVVAEIAST